MTSGITQDGNGKKLYVGEAIAEKFEETAESISLHGLGFLQVKLQGNFRLHIWHPDLPRRACFEHSAVHNHRFSFTSQVLIGTQINRRIRTNEQPLYKDRDNLYMQYKHEGPRSEFGNRPWIEKGLVSITRAATDTVEAGDSYKMDAYYFHSTESGGDGRVATIMKKEQSDYSEGATSLCKKEIEPDVNFDRKQMAPDDMWKIVREVLSCQS